MIKDLFHKISVVLRMIKTYKNWFHLIVYRLNVSPRPMVVALRDGSLFKVRDRRMEPADAYVINEAYLYGIHDKILPYLKKAKIGIDIGAHIGSFSVFAAVRSQAKIFAFEPAPKNLKVLKENIFLNRLEERIIPVFAAVASKNGTIELEVPPNGGIATTTPGHIVLYGADDGPIEKITVPATTLEEIFLKNNIQFCDFIKMDCEGGEYDILYHAPKKIFKKIRIMTLECHKDGSIKELMKFLERQGFSVVRPTMEFAEIFCRNKEIHV